MNVSLETALRCLDLASLVQQHQGIPLRDLASRMGLDASIIVDQLIPALMLCGAPPYLPHDYVNVWLEGDLVYATFADHFERPATLFPMELTALHLALSTVSVPAEIGAEIERRIESLRERIELALPREQRVFLEEASRIDVRDDLDRGSPFLPELRKAVEQRRCVEIDYLSFGETQAKTRVVRPQGLLVNDGVTYLPSFDELRGHLVSFRVDRIASAKLLDGTFEPEPGFSLEEFARDGLFQARESDDIELLVRIRGESARWIAETLQESRWSRDENGDLLVRLPTSRPLAAVRWVISLGPDAAVLAPSELAKLAREEVAKIRQRYD